MRGALLESSVHRQKPDILAFRGCFGWIVVSEATGLSESELQAFQHCHRTQV